MKVEYLDLNGNKMTAAEVEARKAGSKTEEDTEDETTTTEDDGGGDDSQQDRRNNTVVFSGETVEPVVPVENQENLL